MRPLFSRPILSTPRLLTYYCGPFFAHLVQVSSFAMAQTDHNEALGAPHKVKQAFDLRRMPELLLLTAALVGRFEVSSAQESGHISWETKLCFSIPVLFSGRPRCIRPSS